MRIKVIDWEYFEKSNAIYFTRDINIVNEFTVYAIEVSKKNKKILVYMDFVSFKYLGFIELNKSIAIIENSIPDNWVYEENFILNIFTNDLYYQKYSYENLFVPEWMIRSSFLVDLQESPVKAEEEFLSHMK